MEKGNIIKTPRFLNVEIKEILLKDEAKKEGYTEPTHYVDNEYEIMGKHIGVNRMIFAAVKK